MKRLVMIVLVLAGVVIFSFNLAWAKDIPWKYHEVKQGENFSTIVWYYWKMVKVPTNKWGEWNPGLNISRIHPGQKLRFLKPKDIAEEMLVRIQSESRSVTGAMTEEMDKTFRRLNVIETSLQEMSRLIEKSDVNADKELAEAIFRGNEELIDAFKSLVNEDKDLVRIDQLKNGLVIGLKAVESNNAKISTQINQLEKIFKPDLGRTWKEMLIMVCLIVLATASFFFVFYQFLVKRLLQKLDSSPIETVSIRFKYEEELFQRDCEKKGGRVYCPVSGCSSSFENDSIGRHLKWHYKNQVNERDQFEKINLKNEGVLMMNRKKAGFAFVLIFLLLFYGCSLGNRKYIMSTKDVNKMPEVTGEIPYDVYWVSLPRLLRNSEPDGRHDMHIKGRNKPFVGIDVREPGKYQIMVIVTKPKGAELIDIEKNLAIISARSGKRAYSLSGVAFTRDLYYTDNPRVLKFDWAKIKPIGETGIKIWQDVHLDPEKHKKVLNIISKVIARIGHKYPSAYNEIAARVGRITTEDLVIGAANWALVVGIRIWTVAEIIIQKADLRFPVYDTAPVDRFQVALLLEQVFEQTDYLTEEQKKMIRAWWPEFRKAVERGKTYDVEFKKIQDLRIELEQELLWWSEEKTKYLE